MKSRTDFPNDKEWFEYLRQHFAAIAMASDDYESPTSQYDHRAKIWLAKADALIAELNKTTTP